MRSLAFGTEADTRLLMNFIRESEAESKKYCIINLLTDNFNSLQINKRFVRQALFSDECTTLLIEDDGVCIGFIILVNDVASNLQSKPLLLMISELHSEPVLRPQMLNEVGIKKVRCVLPERCEDIETIGFKLEGSIEMRTASNYFYALISKGL